MNEDKNDFKNFGTWTGMKDLMQEIADAREFSPLDPANLDDWKQFSKNPAEVQKLLDASPTYQAMLQERGFRKED
ncbi:MAG TPA: hypothetical protein P5063_07580 [Methanomassiliicoccales archaeon]|nr:hypothetical protein [Methanomassiliicoccales archaeon]